MFKQISTHATAFGLAAMVTLASLGSMDVLANASVANPTSAQADAAPVQQVVVIGQKAPVQQVVIVGQKARRA